VCAALTAQTVAVGPAMADQEPTTSTLTLQSSTAFVGAEDKDVLRIDVGGGNGVGSFGVSVGNVGLCSGSVSGGTGTCTLFNRALGPGTYSLRAIYSGNEDAAGSTSGAVTLTVALQPTTTIMEVDDLSGGRVTDDPLLVFGREQGYSIGVAVLATLEGTPTGTVNIAYQGSSGPVTFCSSTLDRTGEAGFCGLDATTLPVGVDQVTATYLGDGVFAGSSTAPRTITVRPLQTTTTTLTLSAGTVPFGSEQTEEITATVTPSGGTITPTGKVTVATGTTTICTITLSGGTGTCSPPGGSVLAIGSYPLTATYSGDAVDVFSTNTSQTLVVGKQATTTTLKLTADTIAVGSEDAEVFTADVDPAVSGTPTGTVTVKVNGVALCSMSLATGMGCPLKPSQLKVGTYQVTSTYNGDSTYATSISTPPQMLTVVDL
jgi:hypothetical protein